MQKINFNELGDIITPRDLIEAKYPGGRCAVYALFNRADFPKIRHGKKLLVSKAALMRYFGAA